MDESEVLHPSAQRVAEVLRARGVRGPFHEFEVSTKTSKDAAKALGCEVGAIASCLVFIVDEEPVVVIKSGAFRVDLVELCERTGTSSARQASPDEVRKATGQSIGGVSPAGWPRPLRVFIDDSLAQFDRLWSACGTPNAVFATDYDELRVLTDAAPISFVKR